MNMKREIRFISVIVPIYHGKRYIANMIRQVEKCKSYLKKDKERYFLLIKGKIY